MTGETFTCPRHGDYTADPNGTTWNEGRSCVRCRTVARAAESAWRSDIARWNRARHSGIPSRFTGATLATWEAKTPLQAGAKDLVVGWCDEIAQRGTGAGNGITFSGPPGVGKTHIAIAMLIDVLQRTDLTIGYAQWPSVLADLKASAAARDDNGADLMAWLRECDVVVLDELGVRLGSAFDTSALFDVIDFRYRECLPTVVCTNIPLDQAAAVIGERVVDRLRETNEPINLAGPSRRDGFRVREPSQFPITRPAESIELLTNWAGKESSRILHWESRS